MPSLAYTELPPPPRFESMVECLWTVTTAEAPVDHLVLPDGCVDLVFSEDEGLRAVGAMTRAGHFDLPPHSRVAGIRFRPGGARRVLGCAPAGLTDRVAPLADLWGATGRELEQRVGDADDRSARLALLASAVRGTSPALSPVQRALQAVVESAGDIDLHWVARQANVSPRQFRRLCLDETGLTPKHLCRILRFRRLVTTMETQARPVYLPPGFPRERAAAGWATLAADCGYYDQSHLIRDFHEFAGCTPAQYAARFAARHD